MSRRAAVLGHPISHSLSPVLHGAAYAALGLDWTYEACDVPEGGLAQFMAGLDDSWGGLSLTMPLKVEALRLANFVEPQAKLVGAINTLVPSGLGEYRQWVGANTDIHGIVAAFGEAGLSRASRGLIVGGGATATSALAALGSMGVTRPVVAVRDRSRSGSLMRAASAMGLAPVWCALGDAEFTRAVAAAEAVVSTIPAEAGAALGEALPESIGGVLLDVVYQPHSTPLREAWTNRGGSSVHGTRMLLHQAAEQVRLMTGQTAPLERMDAALKNVLGSA